MHPNAQVVMGGFKAFAEGDDAGMKAMVADDVAWHTGGRNRWSGDRVGKDSVLRLMTDLRAEAEFDIRPHAVLADDEHVVVLISTTATRDGKTYEGDSVFVFHVNDGRVTEAWTIPSNPYALDEFWMD